jgi:hypothetical protein
MKASDARNLTDTAFSSEKITYLKNLYKTIEQAANRGINGVNVKSPAENLVESVMVQLKNDGYVVRRDTGYDQRDNDSWDQLYINW